ncbi:MAG: hypothetical protein E4H14_14975 [Candidatus Thorarchaeota archaeon]|nr:MAG: hypothetical protein E4H14_14975 [Candidatus Thorarchaeota archaeon]
MTVPLGYCRPNLDKLDDFVKDAVAVIEVTENAINIPDFVKGDLCADLDYNASRNYFDSTD